MKVGLVSTWGQQCGIATYSEQLAAALAASGVAVEVLAPALMDGGVGLHITPGAKQVPWHSAWQRGQAEYGGITQLAKAHSLDVVHVQHELGLFWDHKRFVQMLRDLHVNGIKSVVTLHTVHDSGSSAHTGFYRALQGAASAIIVHTTSAWASLAAVGSAWASDSAQALIVKIEHGTFLGRGGAVSDGLKALDIPERVYRRCPMWALALGFIGENKNIVGTVRLIAEAHARDRVSKLGLLIVGSPGNNANQYVDGLRGVINECNTDVILIPKFVPEDKVADVLSLAAFGVLNSAARDVYSSSGQVHLFAGHGVPLAVANRPIYSDAVHSGAVSFEVDPGWAERPTLSGMNAVAALARSSALRNTVGKQLSAMAERTAWPNQAKKHVALYKHLLANKGKTR